MKFLKLKYLAIVTALACILFNSIPCYAVIILDSTFKNYGFNRAKKLALAPQFQSVIYFEGVEGPGSGSGVWIGNYQGHGYILTAAHLFYEQTGVKYYKYKTIDGKNYTGEQVYMHPYANNSGYRGGYDLAIVRLTKEVSNAGAQPIIYSGNKEEGKIITFVGYGYLGTGSKGQDTSIDTHNLAYGAQGLIEYIEKIALPIPKKEEAGNYFSIWLPKEDGSIKNPLTDNGITKPVTPLSGLLGSGDSGCPAWINLNSKWILVGIGVNGNGHASYGDYSDFVRLSYLRPWIKKIVPTALFAE